MPSPPTPIVQKLIEKPLVVAIAVVEQSGKFLVRVRPTGVPLAGMAEFPGGKVEPGETVEAAAIRECREESGINVEVLGQYLTTQHRYNHGLLEIHFLRCRPIDAANVSVMPQGSFRWIARDELATLEFPAANAPLTEILLRKIRPVAGD